MNNWHEKKRLSEQLKFFNHKPKRFISCYSNTKPRIRLSAQEAGTVASGNSHLAALYQSQLNRGIQRSDLGYQQMMMAQNQLTVGNAAHSFSYGVGIRQLGLQGLPYYD